MFDLQVETGYGAFLRSLSCGSLALVNTCNCCFCDMRAESQLVTTVQLPLLPWRRETLPLWSEYVGNKL